MYDDKPLSGEAIIDAFFSELREIEGINKDLAEKMVSLNGNNKFTAKEIANLLQSLREEAMKNG